MRHHHLAAATLLACPALLHSAWAQAEAGVPAAVPPTENTAAQAPTRAQPQAPADDKMAVVVTAERRSQNVLKTPMSVIALSGEALRERGVTDLNSLQSQAPSVSFADYGNVKFMNIRGVGVSDAAPNQTVGVAVHWDGTYVAREFVFGDSFFDVASVEVLRGPQGTYTGQNASGGALFINSVRPDFNGVSGFAEAGFGNLGQKKLGGGVTFQLGDKVAARVSGQMEHKNSAWTNLGPTAGGPMAYGNQPGNLKSAVGRGQLLFKPTSDLDLLLIHQVSDRQSDGQALQRFGIVPVGNRTVSYDTDEALNTSYNRTTALLNYTGIEAFKVRVSAAYHTTDQRVITDDDKTSAAQYPALPSVGTAIFINDRYYTGEINLISPDNRPFTWTAGVTALGYRQKGIVARTPVGQGLYIFVDSVRRNQSAFGEVGYKLTSDLELKLGGRYSWDQVGFTNASYLQPFGVGGFTLPLDPGTRRFGEPTGRVVLNWQATPVDFFYGTVSKGYKPGGTTPFGNNYDAETVVNYETGWKARLFDRKVTTAISAFYMDYKGYQATYPTDVTNPASALTQNVDGTKIKGIEGQVGLNTGGLRADASVSLLSAKYGSLSMVQPAGLFGNGLPATAQVINIGGRTIPFAPKFSGAMGVGYDFRAGEGVLTPMLRATYQGAQWVNFYQAPYNRIPSRTLFNARLAYKSDRNWELAAYANNLFNKAYIATVTQATDGVGAYQLGQPREFGVTLTHRFF